MSEHRIDLNCDMGEGYGVYSLGADEEILEYITSANIACGFHAGDPATMRRTAELALERGVAVGAHPGLPDRAGFGRRAMEISPREAADMVTYQVGALGGFVRAAGGRLRHVKPHGALYTMAAARRDLSEAIAESILRFDPELVLFGLAGSETIRAGEKLGLRTASEVFADRSYESDGALTPRQHPEALIADLDRAWNQVHDLVVDGRALAREGGQVSLRADTVCIHGDSPRAVAFAREIRSRLDAAGIAVRPLGEVEGDRPGEPKPTPRVSGRTEATAAGFPEKGTRRGRWR